MNNNRRLSVRSARRSPRNNRERVHSAERPAVKNNDVSSVITAGERVEIVRGCVRERGRRIAH